MAHKKRTYHEEGAAMGGQLSVKTQNLITGASKLSRTARELEEIRRQVLEISRDSTRTMNYAGEKLSFAYALGNLYEAQRGARSLGEAAATISQLYQNNELSVLSGLGKAMTLAAGSAGAAASAAGGAVSGLAGEYGRNGQDKTVGQIGSAIYQAAGPVGGAVNQVAGQTTATAKKAAGQAGTTGQSIERTIEGAEETLERIRHKFGNMTVSQLLTYFFGSHTNRYDGGSLTINAFSDDDSDEELAENTLENLIDIWKYGSCSYHIWQMLTWSGVMDPLLSSLDFKKGPDGCYHVDTEGFPLDIAGKHFGCWQEAGGYTDAYDVVFDAFCDMDRETFEFEVDGKPYTLWFWKGEYLNLGSGGESGIYQGSMMNDDLCTVDPEMQIPMKMTIDYGNGTRRTWNNNGEETWWNTSFDPRQQNIKAEDMKITYEMDFSDHPEAWDGVRKSVRNKNNEDCYFDEHSKKLYYTM